MNTKGYRKYQIINELSKTNPSDRAVVDMLSELANIDFTTAFEMWEYVLSLHQSELSRAEIAENLEDRVFEMFTGVSETKTRALLVESLPLIKLVYGNAVTAGTGVNLTFVVNLILSSKVESAEEILRAMKSNSAKGFDYGDTMRRIVDLTFTTYCAREDVKKASLNRKQSALLLEYVGKIKGPNKMLLTQRIKEL